MIRRLGDRLRRPLLALAAALLSSAAARAAFTVPGFELVNTAPAETSLETKDLRSPAEVWPEMFAAAKKRIDVAQFYVTPKAGEPLEPVLEALEAAGRRGVRIRFLAEKKMETASREGFERLRTIPNLELRVLDFSGMKPGILHAKYIIVDGRTAYLGSQNFDWRSLKHIHELGLRIEESGVVGRMEAVFEHDWRAQKRIEAGRKVPVLRRVRPRAETSRKAYLVASPFEFDPPGVGDSETELVRLLGTAERELAIELLDYAPLTRDHKFYSPIDNALRAAAARGVQVRMLVSNWNTEEPEVHHLKSLGVLPGVKIRIVTLPPSKEGYIPYARVIHAKYMVVDGKTLWLGTSNWTGGYLDNSRNLEAVVKDEALAARALEVHRQLWDSPYAEDLDAGRAYPKPVK